MMDMIEGFARHISEGNWFVVSIVGGVLFIAIFRLFYSLVIELKERKNNDLKSALEIDGLSEDVRYVIQESLNRTYFYRASGISSDPYMRSKIRQFLEKTKGDISLFGIWRTSNYIEIENGKLAVKFGRYEVFDYYWQIISSIVLILACLFAIVFLIVTWGRAEDGRLFLAVQTPLLLMLSIYSIWKASNFHIARKTIAPAFERFEKESTEQKSNTQPLQESEGKYNSVSIKVVG